MKSGHRPGAVGPTSLRKVNRPVTSPRSRNPREVIGLPRGTTIEQDAIKTGANCKSLSLVHGGRARGERQRRRASYRRYLCRSTPEYSVQLCILIFQSFIFYKHPFSALGLKIKINRLLGCLSVTVVVCALENSGISKLPVWVWSISEP